MSLLNGEAGEITYTERGSDKVLANYMTRQCCHCGCHFPYKPPKIVTQVLSMGQAQAVEAEGKTVRGFCMRCSGYICGPGCAEKCVPEEQMLENIEQGRPLDHYPAMTGYTPAVDGPKAADKKLWLPGS